MDKDQIEIRKKLEEWREKNGRKAPLRPSNITKSISKIVPKHTEKQNTRTAIPIVASKHVGTTAKSQATPARKPVVPIKHFVQTPIKSRIPIPSPSPAKPSTISTSNPRTINNRFVSNEKSTLIGYCTMQDAVTAAQVFPIFSYQNGNLNVSRQAFQSIADNKRPDSLKLCFWLTWAKYEEEWGNLGKVVKIFQSAEACIKDRNDEHDVKCMVTAEGTTQIAYQGIRIEESK